MSLMGLLSPEQMNDPETPANARGVGGLEKAGEPAEAASPKRDQIPLAFLDMREISTLVCLDFNNAFNRQVKKMWVRRKSVQ